MYIAEVRIQRERATRKWLEDLTYDLLACWHKNGQVLGEWGIVKQQNAFLVFVSLPAKNSLADKFANKYVRERVKELKGCGSPPEIRVLGPEPESPSACRCKSWTSLVLFTTYLNRESPLRCGGCFNPVPLYRIPHIQDEEYLDVLQWEADYKACDTLQMHTATGERFGERQMFRHDSSLSQRGRQLCASISRVTSCPTYYYLSKNRCRSSQEENMRRCPGCGGSWKLRVRRHLFDFRCDRCLLLSNIAWALR